VQPPLQSSQMQPEAVIPFGAKELILELSHNCNLSCQMCGFVKERNQPGFLMTEQTLNQILDAFENPPEVVRLNGRGESTFHPNFQHYVRLIRSRWPKASLHLFTNFNIRDEDRVLLLKENNIQLFISMDSPDPDELGRIRKGAKLDLMLRNFALLKDVNPRPYIVFTLQAENVHQISGIAEFAHNHNVGLIYNVVRTDEPDYRLQNRLLAEWVSVRAQFQKAFSLLNSAELPCLMPDQIQGIDMDLGHARKTNGKRGSCRALERETCIQYDGHVTPCNMFHPKIFGHISEGKISKILSSPAAQNFRENHKNHPYCQNCAWLGGDE